MASPEEFTLESVRDFMIYRGGRVTNHELVQQFKPFLTHTANKEIARNQFKEYVNTLSNVVKDNDNKYLVLKKRFKVGTALSESAFLNHPSDSPSYSQFPSSPDPGYNTGGYSGPAGYSPNVSSGSYNSPLPPPSLQGTSYGHPGASHYGGALPPQSPQSYLHHHAPQMQYHQSPPPNNMTPQMSQYAGVPSQPPPLLHQDSLNTHYQGFPPSSANLQYPGGQHSELPAPPLPPRSQQHPNNSPYNNGAPSPAGLQQQSYTPPRYRAPPPYRPPPGPIRTPPDPNMYQGRQGPSYPAPLPHHNHHHQSMSSGPMPQQPGQDYYPGQQPLMLHASSMSQYPDDFGHRDPGAAPAGGIHAYQNEPADLGIPPAPVQSMRSNARRNSGSSSPMNVVSSSTTSSRPNMLPILQMPGIEIAAPSASNAPSADELPQLRSTKSKSKSRTPPSGLEFGVHSATPSPVADSPISDSPLAMHRQRRENKENHRPSLTNSESSNSRQESPSSAGDDSDGRAGGGAPRPDSEKKISVKEKTQIFNKMASDTNLAERGQKMSGKSNRGSRAEKDYDDNISILNYGQDGQDWLVASACSDFNEILRLLKVHPELARRKTALHWAAKHGRVEVVKLLAGTHQTDPNSRSNGGYTPLHLAAMYNRQDVFDLLVHYGSELNARDYSGKKPRQYNTIAPSTMSPEHHKRFVQRRNSIKDSASFLRIGSLNVKVRRTTEAFNSLLSRDSSSSSDHVLKNLHKNWGSSDSLPEEREGGSSSSSSSKLMPPPIFGPIKKRKIKKERSDNNIAFSASGAAPSSGASNSSATRPASTPLFTTLSSSLSSSLASLSSLNHNSSSNGGGSGGTSKANSASSSLATTPLTTPTRQSAVPHTPFLPLAEAGGAGVGGNRPLPQLPPSFHPHNLSGLPPLHSAHDSDSDNACGFGSDWQS